jgi:hypothetical protein
MAGTTTKGFRYPTSGDNPAVHTDIKNLADDIDAQLDNYLTGTIGASGLSFEGSTNDTAETTINVIDPTIDRTINFPNNSGTVALVAEAEDFSRTTVMLLGGM